MKFLNCKAHFGDFLEFLNSNSDRQFNLDNNGWGAPEPHHPVKAFATAVMPQENGWDSAASFGGASFMFARACGTYILTGRFPEEWQNFQLPKDKRTLTGSEILTLFENYVSGDSEIDRIVAESDAKDQGLPETQEWAVTKMLEDERDAFKEENRLLERYTWGLLIVVAVVYFASGTPVAWMAKHVQQFLLLTFAIMLFDRLIPRQWNKADFSLAFSVGAAAFYAAGWYVLYVVGLFVNKLFFT